MNFRAIDPFDAHAMLQPVNCTQVDSRMEALRERIPNSSVARQLYRLELHFRQGYAFNKIGTYQEAVLANRHGVPFYPAAPRSTFDLDRTHDRVTIEERGAEEVVEIRGRRVAPRGIPVANPAFDMTPPELVTAMITDRGLIRSPFSENISRLIA